VSRLTYVSLFSGICSATVAWKPLGMEPLAFAEIEPFPAALLAHRYPGVPNLGDVSRVDWSPYRGKADVVVGGSPCQAFSVAGLRKSLEDPRGNLTLEYVRAVHAIRPRYAVWENVPGVLSTNDNAFGCFLGALVGSEEAIMAPRGHRNRHSKWVQKWFAVAHDVPGKRRWRRHEILIEWTAWSRVGVVTGPLGTACWRILDAQYFGLAQRRERVFVVFSPGNRVDPGEILLEWESMRRDSPPSRAQGKSVTGGVAGCAGSGSEWPAEISPPLNTSWTDRSAGSQAQEWDSEKGGRFVPHVGFALNAKGGGGSAEGPGILQQASAATEEARRSAGLQDPAEEEVSVVRSLQQCAGPMWAALYGSQEARITTRQGGQGLAGVRRLTPL
jgi:site-specific DNA-cytosine methylase